MALRGKPLAVICGASGFVGMNLALSLARGPWRLRGISRSSRSIDRFVPLQEAGVALTHADLTTWEGCRRAVRDAQVVFHCAAVTAGAGVIVTDPLSQVTENMVLNARLLHAAHEDGAERLVFVSSATVYPYHGAGLSGEWTAGDGEPHGPHWWVGWMKRIAETLCRGYAERLPRKMIVTVLRPGNLYGPWDHFAPRRAHFVAAKVRQVALREQPLVVWGGGQETRDFVHASDLAVCMRLAAERDGQLFEAANVGTGRAATVREVVEILLAAEGWAGAEVRYDSHKPTTVPHRALDVNRARELWGWEAQVGLEDGLARTLAWYKGWAGVEHAA